jgi:hypothetical protein
MARLSERKAGKQLGTWENASSEQATTPDATQTADAPQKVPLGAPGGRMYTLDDVKGDPVAQTITIINHYVDTTHYIPRIIYYADKFTLPDVMVVRVSRAAIFGPNAVGRFLELHVPTQRVANVQGLFIVREG